MIALNDLNRSYIKLYSELRNYIWSLPTVESLAELEVAVYNRFPNLEEVRTAFQHLMFSVTASDVYRDDEDLQKVVKNFQNLINSTSLVYSPIVSFEPLYDEEQQPLFQDEPKEDLEDGDKNNKDDEEERESSKPTDKKLFHVGSITQSSTN